MKRVTRRTVRGALREFRRQRFDYGILGDGTGVVDVPGRDNYDYARVNGVVLQVFNNRTVSVNNLPVIIGYDPMQPNLLQVLDAHSRVGAEVGGEYRLPAHSGTHEENGGDPIYLSLSQIKDFRIVPDGMTIQIYRGRFFGDQWYAPQLSASWDLSSYQPETGALWLLIYVRENAFYALASTAEDSLALLTVAKIPTPPFGAWPIAGVRLYDTQTAIHHLDDVYNLRWAATPYNAASGASTVTIASGVIAIKSRYVVVDGEGSADDDLVTINGGAHGSKVVLRAAAGRTITVKTTDNITLSSEYALTDEITLSLIYDEDTTAWYAVGGDIGGGGTEGLNRQLAWVEHDLDVTITRHLVGG